MFGCHRSTFCDLQKKTEVIQVWNNMKVGKYSGKNANLEWEGVSGEKANLMEGSLQESRKRDTQSFPNT